MSIQSLSSTKSSDGWSAERSYQACLRIVGSDVLRYELGSSAVRAYYLDILRIHHLLVADHDAFMELRSALTGRPFEKLVKINLLGDQVYFRSADAGVTSLLELTRLVSTFLRLATLAQIPCIGQLYPVNRSSCSAEPFSPFRKSFLERPVPGDEFTLGCTIGDTAFNYDWSRSGLSALLTNAPKLVRFIPFQRAFALDWIDSTICGEVIRGCFRRLAELRSKRLRRILPLLIDNTLAFKNRSEQLVIAPGSIRDRSMCN